MSLSPLWTSICSNKVTSKFPGHTHSAILSIFELTYKLPFLRRLMSTLMALQFLSWVQFSQRDRLSAQICSMKKLRLARCGSIPNSGGKGRPNLHREFYTRQGTLSQTKKQIYSFRKTHTQRKHLNNLLEHTSKLQGSHSHEYSPLLPLPSPPFLPPPLAGRVTKSIFDCSYAIFISFTPVNK